LPKPDHAIQFVMRDGGIDIDEAADWVIGFHAQHAFAETRDPLSAARWTSANQRQPSLGAALVGIASRRAVLGAARGRLAVDDRRSDCTEATSQYPFISVGAAHLDCDVGRKTFDQQQAS
jgi:hypothetical protein